MPPRKPPLYEVHAERGASFTEFGGWDMPVEFDSIRVEHRAVRESAGVFDVSHMGEIEVVGPDATELMQRLTTNDVTELDPGDAQYSAVCREDGVLLDDTVVYRLPDERGDSDDGDAYLFIPNAGHDEQMTERWVARRDEGGLDAEVRNVTGEWAMFAVQGPEAPALVASEARSRSRAEGSRDDETRSVSNHASDASSAERSPADSRAAESFERANPSRDDGSRAATSEPPRDGGTASDGEAETDVLALSPFTATVTEVAGVECRVARTGYTGEDGFELLVPADDAETVWSALADACQPCGLGARDTLRIEQGFLLSGQDFHPEDEPHTPYEAGIGFVVDLDTAFVGRDALAEQREAGVEESFVGIELRERGVARHGYDVTNGEGTVVGRVTSGTMSPTLGKPVALGYLPPSLAEPGTSVHVVVRGDPKRATVVETPFE